MDPTGLEVEHTGYTLDDKGQWVPSLTDETTVYASPTLEQLQEQVDRGERTRGEAAITGARQVLSPLASTPDWQKSSERLWWETYATELSGEVAAPGLLTMERHVHVRGRPRW